MFQGQTTKSVRIAELTAMVVDQDKHMRRLVKSLLYALGFRNLHEASDGGSALQELKFNPADLIVTSWTMEPIGGIELIKTLRLSKDSPCPEADIIMLTANTEVRHVVEARNAGMTEFLAKPVSADKIYTRVMSVLKYPRPYIQTNSYTGPCRRRIFPGTYEGDERRQPGNITVTTVPPNQDDRAAVLPQS